jgi:hypothetical protein
MAETMSNLERYLRHSTGINMVLRRNMIKSYVDEGSITALRALLAEASESHLSVLARQDLSVLVENEDAQISPLQF